MAIRPLRDLLYIIPIREPSEIGQIVLPTETHGRRHHQGVVKYRGPDTSGDIKRGDHVFFHAWYGSEVVMEGEGPLILLREEDVDIVWDDDGEESYLVPIASMELFVKRVVAEINRKHDTTDEEREAFNKLKDRMIERLERKFFDELYF